MKLVTIDPRRIELADYGVLHLAPRPGHERRRDARHRARASSATASSSADFVDRAHRAATTRCSSCSPQYTPEVVEEITGVPAADLERAAHIYGEAERRVHLAGASA